VQILKGLVHTQVLPLGPNPGDIVHDVPQTENELRRGGLLLQREQTLPELAFPTKRFMINQYEVGSQGEGGLTENSGSDVNPEAFDRRLVLRLGLDGRRWAQPPRQLEVVAPIRQRELPDDRGLRRNVDDQIRIDREKMPGNRCRPSNVPHPLAVLSVHEEGADLFAPPFHRSHRGFVPPIPRALSGSGCVVAAGPTGWTRLGVLGRIVKAERIRAKGRGVSGNTSAGAASAGAARRAASATSAWASGGTNRFSPVLSPLAARWSRPAARYQSRASGSTRPRVLDTNVSSARAAAPAASECRKPSREIVARNIPASTSTGPWPDGSFAVSPSDQLTQRRPVQPLHDEDAECRVHRQELGHAGARYPREPHASQMPVQLGLGRRIFRVRLEREPSFPRTDFERRAGSGHMVTKPDLHRPVSELTFRDHLAEAVPNRRERGKARVVREFRSRWHGYSNPWDRMCSPASTTSRTCILQPGSWCLKIPHATSSRAPAQCRGNRSRQLPGTWWKYSSTNADDDLTSFS